MNHLMTYYEISESLIRKHTLDQLKRIRKLTKGIDIGDKIPQSGFGNTTFHHNIPDKKIQTYEDYLKEPFKINQNTRTQAPK